MNIIFIVFAHLLSLTIELLVFVILFLLDNNAHVKVTEQ